MKLIYILAQGHSGSTLTDCILGTHPDVVSSGEMRYLNWQLERTKNIVASVSAQNICSCGKDFRECVFWSEVFKRITKKTGKDIVADPTSFDTAYFGQFAYQNRGGFDRSFVEKVKGYIFREWVEKGWPIEWIGWIEPKLRKWIENNWMLYETMSEVADKQVVVDSSKHLLIALLLQQFQPKDVWIVFLHRDVKGLAASYKKWAGRKGRPYVVKETMESTKTFENRVRKYKRTIPDLQYIDAQYEEIVRHPAEFLEQVVQKVGISTAYEKQQNDDFYINPSAHHMVAGNPMRYRGKQLVRYDESWKERLTEDELQVIREGK